MAESLPLLLTVKQFCEYVNIGETKARKLLRDPCCKYAIKNGNKYLVNRQLLEKQIYEENKL